jgi:glyoxylase-like metal-dependent hydrolase (beta-lactamase superfamily II)
MSRSILLVAALLLLVAGNATAETLAGLPLNIRKFDSGAVRVWIGDHISSTATTAIPTEEGIVVIDTTGDIEIDRQLRQIIARELGRDDFAYLINTHEHLDHTGGNAVYDDCTIIGHELVVEGMQTRAGNRGDHIEWYNTRITELEAEIAATADDDPGLGRQKEQLIVTRLRLRGAREEKRIVVPTKTFSEQMILDLGDTTFEMYFIGGMHSASDIAILVPEQGLLFTGDTMASIWLTDTPGCLASFTARPQVRHDFPLQLANWNRLLERKDEIKTLLTGHWNGELTFDGFESRVNYVQTLWDGAHTLAEAGSGMGEMLTTYQLDTRFAHLVDQPGCTGNNNYSLIGEIWKEATQQESAAATIFRLVDQGASRKAVRQIVDQFHSKKPTHFFLENEFNANGYTFLQSDRAEQAIVVFQINVELYPESWNAYDSLGEALVEAGETEEGIAMYEKSIALNPENQNGIDVLARIRSGASVD